jgi:hypothetical protein
MLENINGLRIYMSYELTCWYYIFADYNEGIHNCVNAGDLENFIKMWGKLHIFDSSWASLLDSTKVFRPIIRSHFIQNLSQSLKTEPYTSMVQIYFDEPTCLSYSLVGVDLKFTITESSSIRLDNFVLEIAPSSIEDLFPIEYIRQWKLNQFTE